MYFFKSLFLVISVLPAGLIAIDPMDGRIGRRVLDQDPITTYTSSSTYTGLATLILPTQDEDSSTSPAKDKLTISTPNELAASTLPAKDESSSMASAKDQASLSTPAAMTNLTPTAKDKTSSTASVKDQTSLAMATNEPLTITGGQNQASVSSAKDVASSTAPAEDPGYTLASKDKTSILLSSTSTSSVPAKDLSSIAVTEGLFNSTAVRLSPSSTIIYPYLSNPVATEAGASLPASAASDGGLSVVPVYTPEILGNAYGGGFIITPSVFVFVSPKATGSVEGLPPGYGFSLAPGEPASVGRSTIFASVTTAPQSQYTYGASGTISKDKTGQFGGTGAGTGLGTAAGTAVGTVVVTNADPPSDPSSDPPSDPPADPPTDPPADPPANVSFIIPTPSIIPFEGFATRLSIGGAATLLLGLLGIMLYL